MITKCIHVTDLYNCDNVVYSCFNFSSLVKLPRIETGDIGINDERCSNTQSCNSDPCLYNNPAYGTKKSSVPENEEEGIYL